MSADALCADLHGDDGSPSSVRVEVSRLRKLLARGSTPTATASPATSRPTCAASRACSRAGAVREAAEAYPGPLLPGSEAPGDRRAREQPRRLAAPGRAHRGDPEALWAWVTRRPAGDDLVAWKRLLAAARVPRPAPQPLRRRVGELRRALA